MSHVIVKDGFAVRIPQIPARYRANCSKEFGSFVHGDTKGKKVIDIQKEGLMKGDFVEMALVCLDKKILTFEPNYINESFTEIWGIPTAGEMKTQFPDNASELSTFLIHRQSQDKLTQLIENFSKEAFNEWVNSGMKGDYHEFAIEKATECYFSNIFRFEFEQTESKHGIYYYVKSSFRKAESEIELKACEIAKEIYSGHLNGMDYCVDERLVLNHQKSTQLLAESKTEEVNNEISQTNGKKKILTGKTNK